MIASLLFTLFMKDLDVSEKKNKKKGIENFAFTSQTFLTTIPLVFSSAFIIHLRFIHSSVIFLRI